MSILTLKYCGLFSPTRRIFGVSLTVLDLITLIKLTAENKEWISYRYAISVTPWQYFLPRTPSYSCQFLVLTYPQSFIVLPLMLRFHTYVKVYFYTCFNVYVLDSRRICKRLNRATTNIFNGYNLLVITFLNVTCFRLAAYGAKYWYLPHMGKCY